MAIGTFQYTFKFGSSDNHEIAFATNELLPEFLELRPSQSLKRRGEPGMVLLVAAWPGSRYISTLRSSLAGHNQLRDVIQLLGARSRPRKTVHNVSPCMVEARLGHRLLSLLEISPKQQIAVAEVSLSLSRFPIESLGVSVRYNALDPPPRLETLVVYQPVGLSVLGKQINERLGNDIEPVDRDYADTSFLVMPGGWALGDAMAALAAKRLRALWAKQDQEAGATGEEKASGPASLPWNASAEDLLRQREEQLRQGLIRPR